MLGGVFKQGTASQPAQQWPPNAADRAAAGNYAGPSLHWCGPEGFMVGLDATTNTFLCDRYVPRQIATPTRRITEYRVDQAPATTQRFDMHACPSGMLLTGYHHGQNIFLCGKVPPPPQDDGGGSTQAPNIVPVSVSGDVVAATEREGCSRQRVRVVGAPQIDVYSGQTKATIPTDQRTDPGEINIRWMCQGPEGSSDEWVDCPATTTVLRVAKNGSDVTFTCVRRAGVQSPNR